MTKRIIKPVYKTSDGKDHKTEAEATRHQELIDAGKALNEAAERLGRAKAETMKTADGQFYDASRWRDYWWIGGGHCSPPRLFSLSLYPHGLRFNEERNGRVEVTWYEHECRDLGRHKSEWQSVYIDQLYADQDAAKKAHGKAVDEWIANMTREALADKGIERRA